MARVLLAVLAALACSASAFSFAPASSVVRSQSGVAMSTQFTDPYVQAMKKKNPKTGSTKNLKGYTVGSRAPVVAKNSGTRITSSYKKEGNVVKSDGGLRGVTTNEQNVPTAVVLGLPIFIAGAAKFLGTVWA